MGGGGKGKKGKGFKGGGAFYERTGPILQAPPLYPPDKMQQMPLAECPVSNEDGRLISDHRRLQHFWKTSPCAFAGSLRSAHQTDPGNGGLPGPGGTKEDLEQQMWEIIHMGGLNQMYFPTELLMQNVLRNKGKHNERSVLDALRRLESKDNGGKGKSTAKEGDGEEKPADAGVEGEAAEEDEEFGDEDYVVDHGDVEDGMGNDFEDDGPDGAGDVEY